jgi:hypothetical protein
MALAWGPTDRSPVSFKPPANPPFAFPFQLSDDQLLRARLQGASLDWEQQARRLRLMVAGAAVGGPCGRALAACGDAVAAELAAVAEQLAALDSARLWRPGAGVS